MINWFIDIIIAHLACPKKSQNEACCLFSMPIISKVFIKADLQGLTVFDATFPKHVKIYVKKLFNPGWGSPNFSGETSEFCRKTSAQNCINVAPLSVSGLQSWMILKGKMIICKSTFQERHKFRGTRIIH